MPLTGKQTRHLRSLGHHLEPVVQIGKHGITEALVAQIGDALLRHELIKVKLLPECPVDRHEAGGELATAAGAELVQMLGKTLLLWKRNPQAARIELPKQASAKQKKAALQAARSAEETASLDDDAPPSSRVIRTPSTRAPARAARPAARGDRPAPRGDRPAPRGDRPAPRGDRPAPRGDRPAPRAARPGEKRPYNRDRRVDDRSTERGEAVAASRSRAPGRPPARRGPPRSS